MACSFAAVDLLDDGVLLVERALEAGADYVGFVFYGPSPRNVDMDNAKVLADTARGGGALRMQPVGAVTATAAREPALFGTSLPTMQRTPKEA